MRASPPLLVRLGRPRRGAQDGGDTADRNSAHQGRRCRPRGPDRAPHQDRPGSGDRDGRGDDGHAPVVEGPPSRGEATDGWRLSGQRPRLLPARWASLPSRSLLEDLRPAGTTARFRRAADSPPSRFKAYLGDPGLGRRCGRDHRRPPARARLSGDDVGDIPARRDWDASRRRRARRGSNLRGPSVRELPAVPADERAFRDGKRFARHYQLDATTGCWTWTTTLRAGHGQFRVGGRTVSAAAWAWERRNGPLPGGRVVEAHLRQRRLRNPDHALAVPPRELVGGKERAKTHCPQGHPYDAQKT